MVEMVDETWRRRADGLEWKRKMSGRAREGENIIERANQHRIRQTPVGAALLSHIRLPCCTIGQVRPYRGNEKSVLIM